MNDEDRKLVDAIVGMREQEALELVTTRLEGGGEILGQISTVVKPDTAVGAEVSGERRETVVLGTVQGDIHEIGKNIVSFMPDVNDFEVCDLGVDVAPERFIEAIRGRSPDDARVENVFAMRDAVWNYGQAR